MSNSTDNYGSRTFDGRTPSLPSVLQMAREGAHGRDWYDRARASVADYATCYGLTERRVCDVLAITSPRVHVSRNVQYADLYLRTGAAANGVMRQIRRALAKYEITGTFGGDKVNAFSQALQGDPTAVVVDVWMIRAYNRGHWRSMTPKRFREMRALIRASATRLGWSPAATQAAIWTGVRARYGFVNAGDLAMPVIPLGGATSTS